MVSAMRTDVTIATSRPAKDTDTWGVVTVSHPHPSVTIGANRVDVPRGWVSPSHPKMSRKNTG